ncbi:MAG: hypothetical protein KDE27_16695 [Planctomycetes bacterium]|nr:hypothetical protein [Planctomycetota bacterium]
MAFFFDVGPLELDHEHASLDAGVELAYQVLLLEGGVAIEFPEVVAALLQDRAEILARGVSARQRVSLLGVVDPLFGNRGRVTSATGGHENGKGSDQEGQAASRSDSIACVGSCGCVRLMHGGSLILQGAQAYPDYSL